jgi:hypothetical protein
VSRFSHSASSMEGLIRHHLRSTLDRALSLFFIPTYHVQTSATFLRTCRSLMTCRVTPWFSGG